jgi:hypothetical protein
MKINNTEISQAFLQKNSLEKSLQKLAHIDPKVVTEFHKHYNPAKDANIGVPEKSEKTKLPGSGAAGRKG